MNLFPHQSATANAIASQHPYFGAIIADEPGLGKTATAIRVGQLACPQAPWAIIAPRNVKQGWREEMEKWFPQKKNFFITHYEEVPKVLSQLKTSALLIVDEAHYLKNTTTERFRNIFPIVQTDFQKRILLLTGTPIYSYPIDLFALLALCRVVTIDQEPAFRKRYCDPSYKFIPGKGYGLDFRGASNLDELKQLCAPYMYRKAWGDVGIDMPKLSFQEVECDVPKESEYKKARADFQAWYREAKGKEAPPLARFTTLRRLLAVSKVSDAIEKLETDMRNPNMKAILFSEFREPIESISRKINAKNFVVLGGDTERKRADTIRDFKEYKGPAVILATTGSLGVGVNLQDATRVYFLDFGFEPARFEQAFRRAWRLGQDKPVVVIRLYCPDDPMETFIIKNQLRKEKYMGQMGVASSTSLSGFLKG